MGGRYVHTKTKDEYWVEECIPIKLNDVWDYDGLVLYRSLKTGFRYSRLIDDFAQKFRHILPEPLSPEQYEQNLFHHGIIR